MKRKLIQMAGKTMVVSLPSDWVKKYNLKKGEEIDVEEKGNQIVLSQKKDIEVEEIKVDLRGHPSFVKRNLNTFYRDGYDKIEFVYDNPGIIDEIQEAVDNSLPGFEILSQTSKGCVIKSIANPEESEFDSTLRRLFLVTLAMGNESFEAVSKGNISELEKIKNKEMTTNKLANYCQRFLNKKGYHDFKKITHLYALVKLLEQIADEYRDLCVYLLKNKMKLSKNTLSFYDKSNKFFEYVYNLFYQFDNKKLLEEKNSRFALIKEFEDNITKMSGKETAVNHFLMNVINKAHHITEC